MRKEFISVALLLCSAAPIFFVHKVFGASVTYSLDDPSYYTVYRDGGDVFSNAGGTELGMYANFNGKEVVAWRNFLTAGNNTGAARSLQVGDVFTITVSATSAFGGMGFSLNDGGTQGGSYANRTSGSRLFVQEVGTSASWEVNSASGSGGYTSLDYNVSSTRRDYSFKVYITSESTANVLLSVDGTDKRAYNLTMNGSAGANIDAFSIWLKDDWNGSSNADIYWKQTTSVQDLGQVELGYFLGGSGAFNPGVISDGLAADNTTTVVTNSVFVGGDSGSVVVLDDANTYGGNTTVNSNATALVANSQAFGTTGAVTVSAGGRIQFSNNVSLSSAIEVSGDGISGSGALVNVSGDNTNNGAITLNAGSRINADGGSLTLSGGVSGGNNVLYVGGANNTAVSSTISGAGASQDGTTTSLYKDGAGTLTLSGSNSYTGDTRIVQGVLSVANSGTLGANSDIFVSGGASLHVATNVTVSSLSATATNNGGNADIASGATLTVDGSSSTLFNNLTGNGKFVKSGSGTLELYGTSTTTGTNEVSAGVLEVSGSLGGSTIVLNTATLSGGGTLDSVTIGTGGTIAPGNSPGTTTMTNGFTMQAGGNYNWEIYDAAGTAGSTNGWDLIAVTGGAWDITGLTSGNKFNINLWSLSGLPQTSGSALNFNSATNYTWQILTYTSKSGSFNPNLFAINTSAANGTGGFANSLNGGVFSLADSGSSLNLVFTAAGAPIPEPGTWAAAALLAGAAAWVRLRRRKEVPRN